MSICAEVIGAQGTEYSKESNKGTLKPNAHHNHPCQQGEFLGKLDPKGNTLCFWARTRRHGRHDPMNWVT